MPEKPSFPEQEKPVLSFEEFSHREGLIPRYNNFFLYFARGSGRIYRETLHYEKFARENSELTATLSDKIQNKMDRRLPRYEALKPFEADLYEAYNIMRSYGVSDQELF